MSEEEKEIIRKAFLTVYILIFIMVIMTIGMVKMWTMIQDNNKDNLEVHEYILDKIGG